MLPFHNAVPQQAHREVERKDADVVRQQHQRGLLGVAARAAVAVAVHHYRQRLRLRGGLHRPKVAALQPLARRIGLRVQVCTLRGAQLLRSLLLQ